MDAEFNDSNADAYATRTHVVLEGWTRIIQLADYLLIHSPNLICIEQMHMLTGAFPVPLVIFDTYHCFTYWSKVYR